METTEKKKHKGGYELLKEKYAALAKERDDWKAKYDSLNERHKTLLIDRDEWKKSSGEKAQWYCDERTKRCDLDNKLGYLLRIIPFWVRWMYRKQFEKGGN